MHCLCACLTGTLTGTPKGKGDFVRKNKFVMPEQRKMKFAKFLEVLESTFGVRVHSLV